VGEREKRSESRGTRTASKARQHNSRRPRCCHDGGHSTTALPVDLSPGCIRGPRSGQETRGCRSVLAAVENQNSHTCDLDQRRLETKGRGSALTAVAHWFGRGYKLTPDTRALAGERVLAFCLFLSPAPVVAASLSRAVDDSLDRRHDSREL
jgi:hypothetical protein